MATTSSFKIPGGKEKGKLLHEAGEETLRWWFNKIADGLREDPNKQYADRDRGWLVDAKKILVEGGASPDDLPLPNGQGAQRSNGNGQARPQTQQTQAMQRAQAAPQMLVAGTFNNAEAASRALLDAGQRYHLVAPATVVGSLPEGCEVTVSVVQIDPYGPDVDTISGDRKNPKAGDTVGLSAVSLARIGRAAGVKTVYSRRTDDGSHPHYCAWEVMIRVRNFDLSDSEYFGNVEIDTREDGDVRGAAAEEIRTKAEKSQYTKDGGDSQLLELRKFLTRHAETKAMNRAIAKMGVRRSYKREELTKPFAIAQLAFTGASADPEARKDFRRMIGEKFLGSSNQLYGGAPQQGRPVGALPQSTSEPFFTPHAPPPIGMSLDQGYGDDVPAPQPTPRGAAAPPPDEIEQPYGDDSDVPDRGPNADDY